MSSVGIKSKIRRYKGLPKITTFPTHLNKHLKCPIAFYLKVRLCVPRPMHENMAFGTAIHYALGNFSKMRKIDGSVMTSTFIFRTELSKSSFTDMPRKRSVRSRF